MTDRNPRVLRVALGIVLFIAMLSCRAVANLPNPFASPTPTTTVTSTATATPSPTPTPTMTPTPRPTGVEVEPQPDGRVMVRDFDNNYEFILPKEWLAFALDKEAVENIMEQLLQEEPKLAELAESMGRADPAAFRAMGMSTAPKYANAAYPTMFLITAIPDALAASLPMAGVTAMIEDNTLAGSTDTTWDVVNNAHGVEVGIVKGSDKMVNSEGKTLRTSNKVIAFQANRKVILIHFVMPREFGEEVLPTLDVIIDTIRVTNPQ